MDIALLIRGSDSWGPINLIYMTMHPCRIAISPDPITLKKKLYRKIYTKIPRCPVYIYTFLILI